METMTNTYTSLHYHIVFSTKNRTPRMAPDVEQRIWAYLGGIAKQSVGKTHGYLMTSLRDAQGCPPAGACPV